MSRAASFRTSSRRGTLAKLTDRYFGHVERLSPADALTFIERIRTTLPPYRPLFQAAQALSGIDWRLPRAYLLGKSRDGTRWPTSSTGVRGMMMLTEDTADYLRVSNRLDPKQSIRAGSRVFLRPARQPARLGAGPDGSWMAVAAYNYGMGHSTRPAYCTGPEERHGLVVRNEGSAATAGTAAILRAAEIGQGARRRGGDHRRERAYVLRHSQPLRSPLLPGSFEPEQRRDQALRNSAPP
ncbi:MAG: transglycosylase SLT domain-containing protein [Betaproteobacteria bacterium]|nr:transglycosylase SLT domain-containing protein [Betaproteobacteria bacterium]